MKNCYFCKGSIELKKISHIHRWKGKFYLFENMKAEVCSQCGEVFLLPEALKYMDKIIKFESEKSIKKISIPVFSTPESLPI